eukprot:SM000195S05277  [mRNA]  locus=s195:211470:211975:+ [translate_table: standard]
MLTCYQQFNVHIASTVGCPSGPSKQPPSVISYSSTPARDLAVQRNEGMDPDLAYEVKDDDMLPDSGPWHYEAVQARNGVAQALLQSLQLDSAFAR